MDPEYHSPEYTFEYHQHACRASQFNVTLRHVRSHQIAVDVMRVASNRGYAHGDVIDVPSRTSEAVLDVYLAMAFTAFRWIDPDTPDFYRLLPVDDDDDEPSGKFTFLEALLELSQFFDTPDEMHPYFDRWTKAYVARKFGFYYNRSSEAAAALRLAMLCPEYMVLTATLVDSYITGNLRRVVVHDAFGEFLAKASPGRIRRLLLLPVMARNGIPGVRKRTTDAQLNEYDDVFRRYTMFRGVLCRAMVRRSMTLTPCFDLHDEETDDHFLRGTSQYFTCGLGRYEGIPIWDGHHEIVITDEWLPRTAFGANCKPGVHVTIWVESKHGDAIGTIGVSLDCRTTEAHGADKYHLYGNLNDVFANYVTTEDVVTVELEYIGWIPRGIVENSKDMQLIE